MLFIQMRRYEGLTVHKIMQGIKVKDIRWLLHRRDGHDVHDVLALQKTEHEFATFKFAQFIKWLFCSFITDLLRASIHGDSLCLHVPI